MGVETQMGGLERHREKEEKRCWRERERERLRDGRTREIGRETEGMGGKTWKRDGASVEHSSGKRD